MEPEEKGRSIAMHARVSTYQGPPNLTQEQVEEMDSYDRENILPQVRQLDGFKGVIALLDRQSGKALSVTLWESEQAMRASEQDANQLRQESAEAASETVENVERYEVSFFETQTS
jgi:heme-degrading monooxygenase HmoA